MGPSHPNTLQTLAASSYSRAHNQKTSSVRITVVPLADDSNQFSWLRVSWRIAHPAASCVSGGSYAIM
jgi:hypothetical protein